MIKIKKEHNYSPGDGNKWIGTKPLQYSIYNIWQSWAALVPLTGPVYYQSLHKLILDN